MTGTVGGDGAGTVGAALATGAPWPLPLDPESDVSLELGSGVRLELGSGVLFESGDGELFGFDADPDGRVWVDVAEL